MGNDACLPPGLKTKSLSPKLRSRYGFNGVTAISNPYASRREEPAKVIICGLEKSLRVGKAGFDMYASGKVGLESS